MKKQYEEQAEKKRLKKKSIIAIVLIIFAVGVQSTDTEKDESITYKGETYVPKKNISTYLIAGIDSSDKIKKLKEYDGTGQCDTLALIVQDRSTIVVKDGKKTLKEGVDYKVSNTSHKAAGKHVVKVTGLGKYAGQTWKGTYTIKQAKQTVKVSRSSYTVKASKVKKATQSTRLKVTKKAGKTTYKSNYSKIKVKNGKIYVKKGAKKGTYKITVTVKDANYKTVTKTIKVRVK